MMKHMKCDICGFEAGRFKHVDGKMVCIECENVLELSKFTTVGSLVINKKVADSFPRSSGESAKQLKFKI
jgi:hypothetical protein